MKVDLYTICWNEADTLGFFFRHYDSIVDRYVIYDDGSDDGSLDILSAHPRVEVRRFTRGVADSFVKSHQALQNTVWKESRGKADWVIITAIDEHLVLPGGAPLRAYLQACGSGGINAVPAIGFQMVADHFPAPDAVLSRALTKGAPFGKMNKLSIFSPDEVSPSFTPGRHKAVLSGGAIYPDRDELMLLHYKFIDFERTLKRQQALNERLGEIDRKNRWGYHYARTRDETRAEWDALSARALDISADGFRPDCHVDGSRWWRETRRPSLVKRVFSGVRW